VPSWAADHQAAPVRQTLDLPNITTDSSIPAQAARLGDQGLHDTQRRALASHIGRMQGNQHIQRVVGAVQAQRKMYDKAALKSALVEILNLQLMNQRSKASIQLSSSLLGILQMVTSLSTADIKLLWRTPPSSAYSALKRLDHSLPVTVPESTMKRLRQAKMSLMLGAKPAVTRKAPPAGPKAESLPGQEKDPLLKQLAAALQNKPPEDKSANTEAVKKLIEGYLGTSHGTKIKEKSLRFLFSKKGAPFTVAVGSGALAAMFANNTTIPSTPEIPIRDNLSIKFEFEGTLQKPTGFKVMLKFTFGGPVKQKRGGREQTMLGLPKELHAHIDRIDRRTFFKWFAGRAFYEWESATPEQEDQKLAFYKAARDRPDDLGLPDTRLIAEHIARALVGAAIQNRISQLQGKGPQKQIVIDLGHAHHWDRLLLVDGLEPRLTWLLGLLVPKVPYAALGIEQVTFKCGKRPIKVPIKR
jgi:hypothetical protein